MSGTLKLLAKVITVYFPAKGIGIMDKGDLHFLPILWFESQLISGSAKL